MLSVRIVGGISTGPYELISAYFPSATVFDRSRLSFRIGAYVSWGYAASVFAKLALSVTTIASTIS